MNNEGSFTLLESLSLRVEIPEQGILSKPVFSNSTLRATLFGMAQGEELTEHTASMESLLVILEGEAEITLSGETHMVHPGAWLRMEPRLPHSLRAQTPLKFVLWLLRERQEES
jgi:quercetin dioxygenase-like cupin family protein